MKTPTKLRNGARVWFRCATPRTYPIAQGVVCGSFMDGNARFYKLRDVSLWYRAELRRADLPDARVIRAARDIVG